MSIRWQTAVKLSAFNKLMAGLEDARVYLDGQRSGFAVHKAKVPEPMLQPSIVQGERGRSQTGRS